VFSAWVVARAHEIADALAARLGIPTPPLAWVPFAAQIANETANGDPSTVGVQNANPLNLTTGHGRYPLPGMIGHGRVGGSATEQHSDFAAFPDPTAGARAAGYFYSAEADPAGYYAGVRRAFIGGDPVAIARAIEDSPFATGHYSYNLSPAVAAHTGRAAPGPVNIDAAPYAPPGAPAMSVPDLLPDFGLPDVAAGISVITGAPGRMITAAKEKVAVELVVVLLVILALVLILAAL
jgi:hypothetical protein